MLTPSDHSKPLTIDQSRSRLRRRPISGPGEVWLRNHGGYLVTTLAIAVSFGALTGSTVLMLSLVAFALVGSIAMGPDGNLWITTRGCGSLEGGEAPSGPDEPVE